MIISACSWSAINPLYNKIANIVMFSYSFIRSLKSLNFLFFVPRITFTNSSVSLKGALSNYKPLPGALESKNP